MQKEKSNEINISLLKKWCTDCEYKGRTWLHDPCHYCMEDEFVDGVPKYYKEEKRNEKSMNKYVVVIYHYFKGYQQFTVEAKSKSEALEKAKEHVIIYGGGNYNINDAKVLKKVRK